MFTATLSVRSLLLFLALAGLSLLTAMESGAIDVTETSDWPVPLPGYSLRQALNAANEDTQTDVINIPEGIYTLNKSDADEDNNLDGDLDVKNSVYIVGKGPEKTFIDGSGLTRVLHIVQTDVSVGLVNLTIQNGKVTNNHNQPHGAGILNKGILSLYNVGIKNNTNAADNNFGGGIYNDGVLTIINATLSGNLALSGGAIYTNNSAQTAIERSLLVNNWAYSRASAIESFGSLQVTNTTVDGNASTYGSAIHLAFGTTHISFCTITNNTSGAASAAIEWGLASLNLHQTLLAANQSAGSIKRNCSYKIADATYNLEDANTCGFSPATNLVDTDPKLGPLQDNGGPTQTRALAADSPAIDYVKINTGVIVDQRGFTRPVGPWADIGAYEYEPPPLCFPVKSPDGKSAIICL